MLNKKVRAEFLATMKTTIEMQMSVIPITMTYSSTLTNYRDTGNQRLPNESDAKINNRRIQTTASHGGRGVRGGHGHQGHSGRGGCGVHGRGTVREKDDREVTVLNVRTIRVYPAYRFENDQWFNIPEDTRLQLI